MTILEAHDVTCIRGNSLIFQDLSLRAEGGHALVVRGANGSGKTSLLRVLAGLLPPTAGWVTWSGDAPLADSLHWVGPGAAMKPALRVIDNLGFWAATFRAGPDMRPPYKAAPYNSVLSRMGLDGLAAMPTRHLSAGQMRRLSLCRLLLAPRPVWVLDEPEAALDRAGCTLIRALVDEHCAAGGLAIISSHDPALWDGYATRVMAPVSETEDAA